MLNITAKKAKEKANRRLVRNNVALGSNRRKTSEKPQNDAADKTGCNSEISGQFGKQCYVVQTTAGGSTRQHPELGQSHRARMCSRCST